MKKTIALILSAALLLTASLCAFPVSAETENTDPINATPLTGYTVVNSWQYNADAVMPGATAAYTTATGVKLSENYMGEIDLTTNGYSSYIYAQAMYSEDIATAYKLPVGFAENGSFIIYVKTDAANKMTFTAKTECPSQWFTSGKISANGSYTYLETDSGKWENATADENGVISFESAFDGYVRIPVSSLISMDGVPMEFNYLAFIDIRFGGIGGKFGTVTVGPFFVTTDDSTSTKIVVPEEYQPKPINVMPIIGDEYGISVSGEYSKSVEMPEGTKSLTNLFGARLYSNTEQDKMGLGYKNSYSYLQIKFAKFELPKDFGTNGNFIIYVKTSSANEFTLTTLPNGEYAKLKADSRYEYARLGDKTWTTAKTKATEIRENYNGGLISFDAAFDGFIKIPAESIDGYDYAEQRTFDYLAHYININIGGIGGKFGDVTVGPFFVTTEDSASTKLIVPEDCRPAPLNIKTFDFGDVHAATYAFSADKLESTNNYKLYIGDSVLSETSVKYQGSDVTPKWSYLENGDGIEGADNWTALVMNTRVKTYMKDAAGIVFYVNFPKANMFSPCLTFDGANSIMLKPGEKVYVLQNGSDTWAEKSVENGYNDNALIYGKVTFDSAFEGYIKVPFTSLNSDWGWKPTLNGDNMSALTSVTLRFKGIGDDTMYGKEITAGVTGYYTTDTARAEIGSVTKPEYAAGDANYDWKVDSQDLVDVRKTLMGAGTYTGYDVTVLDLISVKKVLSNVQ